MTPGQLMIWRRQPGFVKSSIVVYAYLGMSHDGDHTKILEFGGDKTKVRFWGKSCVRFDTLMTTPEEWVP